MSDSFHHDSTKQSWLRGFGKGKTFGITVGLLAIGLLSGSLLLNSLQPPLESFAAVGQSSISMSTTSTNKSDRHGFAEIVKKVKPAVVNITARTPLNSDQSSHFFEKPGLPQRPREPFGKGMGSGVIVIPDGFVVTNHHVVEGAKDVTVTLPDKRKFKGQIVGTDPQSDLAVVKINGEKLPSVPWGDSSILQVGDYVLAIGNPFGLNSTVTQGIVSALGRVGMGITQYEDFIQTDAAINPGNSGGALVNVEGKLVGINTAIISRTDGYQGVGFAIPANMGKPIYDSLVQDGKVTRGYLGVRIQEVTPDLAQSLGLLEPKGALVTNVKDGSPAKKAGLTRGDTIVKFQGHSITDPRSLQSVVTRTPVGTSVTITVIRDSHEQELSTVLTEHPDTLRLAHAEQGSEESKMARIAVDNLTPQAARQLGMSSHTNGVIVTAVRPGSQAESMV